MYTVVVYNDKRVIESANFYDASSAYKFYDHAASLYTGKYNIRFSARK